MHLDRGQGEAVPWHSVECLEKELGWTDVGSKTAVRICLLTSLICEKRFCVYAYNHFMLVQVVPEEAEVRGKESSVNTRRAQPHLIFQPSLELYL